MAEQVLNDVNDGHSKGETQLEVKVVPPRPGQKTIWAAHLQNHMGPGGWELESSAVQAHATDDDCQKPSRRTHVHVEIQEAEVSEKSVHIFGPIEVHLHSQVRTVCLKLEGQSGGEGKRRCGPQQPTPGLLRTWPKAPAI